ncbi:IclR family transcriptional regulator [Haladaptatus caseinilyticus]|uniref:IclR family transcriptional regulator n=1 Tax=Haladaptatus caseinilyticus TaxID=2993314 RepID=UPI00224B1E36|nr:IclR family transcriptional regulator [Haladaptatus caseinilyticus]
MVSSSSPSRPLKTIETAVDIVDTIQRREGADIQELAQEFSLAQSTIHGYVKTLENRGYLTYEDGAYHVGLEFLNKGGHARKRKREYDFIINKLEDLAERTGERVQFIVEENGRGYYIHTSIGENAVHVDAHIGKKIHLHASSAGKAILAHLPKERVHQILDRWGMPDYTQQTITNRDELLTELRSIRDTGYATSEQESITGLRAVGTPIQPHEDEPIGAISFSGPAHRLTGDWFDEEIPNIVLGVANEIELDLKYQ